MDGYYQAFFSYLFNYYRLLYVFSHILLWDFRYNHLETLYCLDNPSKDCTANILHEKLILLVFHVIDGKDRVPNLT